LSALLSARALAGSAGAELSALLSARALAGSAGAELSALLSARALAGSADAAGDVDSLFHAWEVWGYLLSI
jgi:hypothetical protein